MKNSRSDAASIIVRDVLRCVCFWHGVDAEILCGVRYSVLYTFSVCVKIIRRYLVDDDVDGVSLTSR